jgi:hypothetical protein
MVNVFFYRKHHYFNLFGEWKIFINNKSRLSLSPNDILEIKLKPDAYNIQIKSGCLKSNIINIKAHDEDEIYFLVFIDMPYWKKLPFIFLYLYLKQGGLLRIIKVNKRVFFEKTRDEEGLIWL